MQFGHLIGALQHPLLRGYPRLDAHVLEVGASGAVRQEHATVGQQL